VKITEEQKAIIAADGNIRINAVAGSGKTTTLMEYARVRPEKKILYLAFNKSVKIEAEKKLHKNKLRNVKVMTAHGLAYSKIAAPRKYQVTNGYKSYGIVELLNINSGGESFDTYIIANHVLKMTNLFLNSAKKRVMDIDYMATVIDPNARAFVHANYQYIVKLSRILLDKMLNKKIAATHDFYLKLYQQEARQLPYDIIFFDEGQDASPVMLDIFFRQKSNKIIVGDTHQQIYSWRHAVNSLEKANYPTYNLSSSFRFNQDIADLAMDTLDIKKMFKEHERIRINGMGAVGPIKSRAVIARTNMNLLEKAIDYVYNQELVDRIYFEGNIERYTYASEGGSLYDVMNLYYGNHNMIRDPILRKMKDIDELEEYIKKTEDGELDMMRMLVIKYGKDINNIIQFIKSKHVEDYEKDTADMIFSTTHRCKGMEYDSVELAEDFIKKETIETILEDSIPDDSVIASWNEEVNLLYVAVTRAKSELVIPDSLLPGETGETIVLQ